MAYWFTYELIQEITLAPGVTVGDNLEIECELELSDNGGQFYVDAISVEGYTRDSSGKLVTVMTPINSRHPLWAKIEAAAYQSADLQTRYDYKEDNGGLNPEADYADELEDRKKRAWEDAELIGGA